MDVAGVEPVEVDVEGFGVGFLEGDGGLLLLLLIGCCWESRFDEVLQEGRVFGEDVCVGVEGCLVGCGFGVEEFDGYHRACRAGRCC